jgi:hypothetical protein
MGDLRNLNNTFQRGVQPTDEDGVAQFDGIFPGHYFTRAVHIHFMVHLDATVHPNGTIWSNQTSHVGQGFFDMDLIDLFKAMSPYSDNEQALTRNTDDAILRQEAATTDPFFEYVLLGDDVADGVLAWLRFGINTTFTRTVQAAAMRYEEGGQMNTNNPGGLLSALFPGDFQRAFPPHRLAYPPPPSRSLLPTLGTSNLPSSSLP